MSQVKEFSISVPQEHIDRLKQKLSLTTFPDELDDAGWDYGAPLADIKRLHNHWLNNYDWRTHEQKINRDAGSQYTADVPVEGFGSLNIHFVHQKSKVKDAIPLLFCHGWPGSFIEVFKILPALLEGGNGAPAFHVVAPSLPGYGFSEGAKKRGFGPVQCAELCHNLMLSLGYPSYATQGGDWGYFITRLMGLAYPSHCRASHINMATPSWPKPHTNPLLFAQFLVTPFSAAERAGLERSKWFEKEGMGYFKQQATKPQTIGYAQADSPVGLLAWIYEKLHDWTDWYPWTDDEVITWVSIYWFSRAGPTAAARLYYEAMHDKSTGDLLQIVGGWVPGVKLGIAHFPKELINLPRLWHQGMGEVVFESVYESGGHFAAWERPDAIVDDLRKMFGRGGGAFGVVGGCSGYGNEG
ncbi:hypothetical protein H2201_001097 [Coniosporium apollinis]|uniref:Epoxide hydrolase N-terminal domain-containing protein n=1 Tax=Coniosporium apollinis TaxID=61459 RepID=A0ABQ9P2M9_9PEZI|nr:hypothetical protein H2201_001097 [Coniosporium apollinis]